MRTGGSVCRQGGSVCRQGGWCADRGFGVQTGGSVCRQGGRCADRGSVCRQGGWCADRGVGVQTGGVGVQTGGKGYRFSTTFFVYVICITRVTRICCCLSEHGATVPCHVDQPLGCQSTLPQLPSRLQRTLQSEGPKSAHTDRPPAGVSHITSQCCYN